MNKVFSPNMLKTFEECPKKFFIKYIKNISVPQSAKLFEKGKNIHALASYYLKGFNIDKLENALNKEEKEIWQNLKNNKYFSYTPVGIEYTLCSKIGEYWIGGRLDALVKDGENFYILDYKTGSAPKNPEKNYQTLVYLINVDKKFPNHKDLKFIYLDLKNKKEIEVDYKNCNFKNLKEICKKIDFATKNQVFKKTCNTCEYEKICEVIL